jgi:hypothetical protein
MKKITVYFKAVPNPMEKGYISYQFIHPVHGRKVLGCFRKDLERHQKTAQASFASNCGHATVDNFNFIEGDKP